MTTLTASQHIYSNVEAEQSPRGKGGFQTLFYTQGALTEAEITEMESRLLYFSSEVEPVKRLFFTTAGGKGVVSQIVVLQEPDKYGRKGRYLAHSLVFEAESLPLFAVDPFAVFANFSFIESIAGAMQAGDFSSGNIAPVQLNLSAVPQAEIEQANRWNAAELKKLALLTLRVKEQARQREAITFAGTPDEILSALQSAWLFAPIALRPHCSFDSYFYRCNLVATWFWAIGLPEPPLSVKFALVNASTRQIQGAEDVSPQTAYERWALALLEKGKLSQIPPQREAAFALAEWLDGRHEVSALPAELPAGLVETMFAVSPQSVLGCAIRCAGAELPPELAERAGNQLYRQAENLALYRQMRNGFAASALAEALFESYCAEKLTEPSRKEIKALEVFLTRIDAPLLRLSLAYWDNPRKTLPAELAQVDAPAYNRFCDLALRLQLVKPFDLLVASHAETFVSLYLANGGDDIPGLTEQLLEMGQPGALHQAVGALKNLSAKELGKLNKLIEDTPNVPEAFQNALNQTLAAQPKKLSLGSRLKELLKRD